MRLAHLSDCHLGFRVGPGAYRSTSTGMNQREVDVANAFRAAVDGVLAAKPDIVLIAGDLFHHPKPPNPAIIFAFDQLTRLRDAGLPVVLAAGNHDLNKTVETGCILHLFKRIGVDLAIDGPQQFDYPDLDLSVTAVPDRSDTKETRPGTARYNVLVAHGMVEGTCPKATATLPRELIDDERWTFCALGDYHVRKEITPRAWYCGSLEFTSSDIWSEADTPKGWLLVDLDAGTVEPQLVPTRTVLDLESFDATDMPAEEVNRELFSRLADISGKLVRLKVLNIPTPILRQLDHRQLKRLGADAMGLKIDFIRPERVARERATQMREQRTIVDQLLDHLLGRELPVGMDRAALTGLASDLMAEVTEKESPAQEQRGAA